MNNYKKDNYFDEVKETKELHKIKENQVNYRYIKRNKKLKESFKFEDLLTESQVEKLLKYVHE